MKAGQLDRRVQFRRAAVSAGAFGQAEEWADHGAPVWAAKKDVSDGERWRAGDVAALRLTLGSIYEHREDVITGTISSRLPLSAQSLLMPHVFWPAE